MTPEELLKQISQEVAICKKCVLNHSRKRAVAGEGPANARIMFIGEGPGFHENEQGRPFVGQAGKFLDELLAGIKMKREEVFIANVVKCRPPGNRDPLPEELAACGDYLERQINIINPQVIVTLGRFSMARFLPTAKISEVHGRSFRLNDRLIVPMFHPAAALHQPSLRPLVEQDFSRLPQLISQPLSAAAPAPDSTEQKSLEQKSEPKQLNLF